MIAADGNYLAGSRLSHYCLHAPIGSGGMGTVYRARDERLQRDVAVKVLIPGLTDGELRRTLLDEARILSRVNHPNVGAVYDAGSIAGHDFLVLELVPGLTLDELLARGPLSAAEARRLGAQIARGLAAAHAAGIVHRDVKPANIKVTPSGELKLLDFGVAKLLRDPRTPSPATTDRTLTGPLGTVPFMAPEQLRGDAVDERSDVFSAGTVLYQMVTGRPAFPETQLACLVEAVLNVDPVRPRTLNPTIPRSLEAVVLKALQKVPAARYQSAEELLEALEAPPARAGSRLSQILRTWSASLFGVAVQSRDAEQPLRL